MLILLVYLWPEEFNNNYIIIVAVDSRLAVASNGTSTH